MSRNQRETESERPARERETGGDVTFTMDNLASSEVAQTGKDSDVNVVPQATHGDRTFSMDMIASSEVARPGNDSDVNVVPQATHGDRTFSMDMVASSEVSQPGNDNDVNVVPQGTYSDGTFSMDMVASSEVAQTGNDSDVNVVSQGTHGDGTFSMDMIASSEVVERRASVMAVSERRERQAVSTRITAGSDFKGIIVQDSSDVILSVGGQNDGIMKSDMLQINLKRVKDVFEKTANYRRVKELLEKYDHVAISGASGEGKTSIALMIGADLRNQGYELVFVDDVDKFELKNCDLRGKKVCLILDDIFGTVSLSTDVPHLRSILQNLKQYLEDAKSSKELKTHPGAESVIRVMFTTKSYNLECGVAKLEGQEYYFFTGPSLLDLTKMKSCHYSPEERKKILQKQLKHHNIDLDLDIVELCDTRESLFGFPLICTLFCEFLSFQKEPSQFFQEPLFYLRREIDMIMERRNDQSAALILMLLCEDHLNLSQVEFGSENDFLEAVKSVVPVTSRTTVAKAVRCYRGVFFTDGDILGFSHPTIYDACACALFKMNPSFVLNHCSIRFLYERVQAQPVQSTAIDNHLHIIYVSEAYYDTIASRLADAVAKGNYSMSITHPILRKEQLVDKVFQMLKLKKLNTLKRLLNTKDTKRLAMLHAKEEEKHLLYWAVHAHSLYLVEKILDFGYHFSDEEIKEAFNACASCGNEAVLLLLSSKYMSLFHQSMLNKALVTATDNNYKGVALALLNIGADIFESKNDVGENVFQIAKIKGFSTVGRELFRFITKGFNITDLTGDFDFQSASHSALQYSCRVDDIRFSQFFLPVADINARDTKGRTLLMIAALHGNYNVFNLFRSQGADVHITDDDTKTVLHWACQGRNISIKECPPMLNEDWSMFFLHGRNRDNISIVEALLPLFDINCRGKVGLTPAMTSALYGKKDVFNLLVSKGADLTIRRDNNDTILHVACAGGKSPIVEALIPLFDINCRGKVGFTPAMIAGLYGKKDVFNLLVSKGADLTIRADNNHTILHVACRGGKSPIVEALLPLFDINCRGEVGFTPAMTSALYGKKDVFDMLVSKGADLTIRSDNNHTILHVACRDGKSPIVEALLPLFDINCRGEVGFTPAMTSALYGKKDVFDLLVSKGADLTIRSDNNNTFLHVACRGGKSPIVQDLFPLFDINCRGEVGFTPAMTSALYGQKDVFDLLVSKGADLTIRANNNDTILHVACRGGNTPIVEALLPLFDINCRGSLGWTPLMCAASKGNHNVWELLLKRGGNCVCVGDNNHTTLHTTCRGGNMLIVEDVIGDFDIDTRGLHGRTPLLEAARGGQIPAVDFLVSRNADVKIVDNMDNSLLHVACIGGHLGMVKHVCPWFNIDDGDTHGWTPTMVASVFGESAVFDYLRRQGTDLTLVDKTGDDVFTLALQGGSRQIIERLSPDGQYVKKHTPWTILMRSVVTGSFEKLKVCPDNSPDLVQTDQFGDSLLHLACRGGNRHCVEYLLPTFDINVRGRYSWTPVMMAAVCGHGDVFQLLVDHKADLCLVSDTSECILTLAKRRQSNAIVEYLRNKSGNSRGMRKI
ncbi:serine/threonine-protein phosphatase 6 regulatory ankyrin repeat subunit C-like isoform X2 [Haliotis rubra]|uniref:serine/threonine-protein phosphatase 6 regulatory ankyrin repeat subunit C-like isoform X2 n=1 Tax=Haliotis rubra TaxID=36100 RepID=UPI001EE56460|nr:serine/threonine-protein phosphatase 6 regulatory ankyrin repeat subunit C-like isoform X2 [Haliotis rubra]